MRSTTTTAATTTTTAATTTATTTMTPTTTTTATATATAATPNVRCCWLHDDRWLLNPCFVLLLLLVLQLPLHALSAAYWDVSIAIDMAAAIQTAAVGIATIAAATVAPDPVICIRRCKGECCGSRSVMTLHSRRCRCGGYGCCLLRRQPSTDDNDDYYYY